MKNKNVFRVLFNSILLLTFIFCLFSCEKETVKHVDSTANTKITNANDEASQYIAKIVANSLRDREGRTFIKKEAVKQFDGDYDILFAELIEKELDNTSLKSSGHETYFSYLQDYAPD